MTIEELKNIEAAGYEVPFEAWLEAAGITEEELHNANEGEL